jgi:hypothetical protein
MVGCDTHTRTTPGHGPWPPARHAACNTPLCLQPHRCTHPSNQPPQAQPQRRPAARPPWQPVPAARPAALLHQCHRVRRLRCVLHRAACRRPAQRKRHGQVSGVLGFFEACTVSLLDLRGGCSRHTHAPLDILPPPHHHYTTTASPTPNPDTSPGSWTQCPARRVPRVGRAPTTQRCRRTPLTPQVRASGGGLGLRLGAGVVRTSFTLAPS